MFNEKTKELMYKAAERLPSSGVIMARILSDVNLQRILKKYGAGKPIVIICGEPAAGKTSSVRTLIGEHSEIKFVEGLKKVKKTVETMTNSGDVQMPERKLLFLDNFPKPLSAHKLEVGRRILDYVIDIVSENENAPITLITGEMNLLQEIEKATSLQERSLIMKMNKIDEDKELFEIREYFSVNQLEYEKQWELYDAWALKNPIEEDDVLQRLREFRKKYNGRYENRQVGLVFCYYYTIYYHFSEFLESMYGEKISAGKIQRNIKELFEWKESIAEVERSYEVEVWKEFLIDNRIRKVYLPSTDTCEYLVEGTCGDDYDPAPYKCRRCKDRRKSEKYYNPMELRLEKELESALLIESVSLIPYFPKHVMCDSPLLVIRRNEVVAMLNDYLEEYSRKIGSSVRRITPNRFTKAMYERNRILFKYEGVKRGNAYTFGFKDTDNEDIRVLFIKLTNEEYKILRENAKRIISVHTYSKDSVDGMRTCLEEFSADVRSLIGEIGAPSKVLEAFD